MRNLLLRPKSSSPLGLAVPTTHLSSDRHHQTHVLIFGEDDIDDDDDLRVRMMITDKAMVDLFSFLWLF